MAKYIVKRVAMGIFSVFIVATLTFFIMNLVPGGPFVAEKSISKAAQQALAEKYGLVPQPKSKLARARALITNSK